MSMTALSFPQNFKTDDEFFNEALAEFNRRRRAEPNHANDADLSYQQLGPFSQQWVRARAQRLKALAKESQ